MSGDGTDDTAEIMTVIYWGNLSDADIVPLISRKTADSAEWHVQAKVKVSSQRAMYGPTCRPEYVSICFILNGTLFVFDTKRHYGFFPMTFCL